MNIYEKFQEKLDSLPIPSPKTESRVELEIFKRLMSPEEAEVACNLSGQPEDLKTISQRAGMEVEKLAPVLEELARRGVIFKVVFAPEPLYCLVPVMPGVYEFQLNRLSPEMVNLFDKYYDEKQGEAVFSNKTPFMRVVPVNKSIPAELNILTYEEAYNLIDESPTVCLATCLCRTNKELIGEGCTFPKDDICIPLTPWAEYYIKYGLGRKASKEEAKNALKRAAEAGLVHCAMNVQKGGIGICNCCGCCCAILRGVTQLKIPTAVAKSNFVAELSEDECTGCGDCVDRCQVQALELTGSTVALKEERCIGCGLCVTTCPAEAITLKRRQEEIVPPNDINDLMVAIQKGREVQG